MATAPRPISVGSTGNTDCVQVASKLIQVYGFHTRFAFVSDPQIWLSEPAFVHHPTGQTAVTGQLAPKLADTFLTQKHRETG